MLNLTSGQIDKSFQVLLSGDPEIINRIKRDENKVDKLDIKIDKLCQRIFALAQPVAGDLRFIMASLRIGTEMERISDMAYEITERSESVSQYEIPGLLDQIRKLFTQLNESFSNNNSMLAYEIIGRCKERDEDCKSIFRDIVAQMTKKSNVIVIATDLILIIRNLERIIGHMENIAESVIFIADAKIVRHPRLSAGKNKTNQEEAEDGEEKE
jgi:phosphate transport system protein